MEEKLLQAIRDGDLNEVIYLHTNKTDIHHCEELPLIIACQEGNLPIVEYLVENKCNIHGRASDYVPIEEAIIRGHLHIVKFLHQKGAIIQSENVNTLVIACENGRLPIVKYLIENKVSPDPTFIIDNFPSEFPADIPIVEASRNGYLDIVKYLHENKADIHFFDDCALVVACSGGHLHVVKYLVENGANVNAYDGKSLYYASCHNYIDVVKYLVENKVNIHYNREQALIQACYEGNLDIVKYLHHKGANLRITDDVALISVCNDRYIDTVEGIKLLTTIDYLLINGCNPGKLTDYISSNYYTPINVENIYRLYKLYSSGIKLTDDTIVDKYNILIIELNIATEIKDIKKIINEYL